MQLQQVHPRYHNWNKCPSGGVVPRGVQVRKGAHALRRERVCVPDLCSAPQGGATPLHRAVRSGKAACVEKLLKAGAAMDATDPVRGKGY